MHKKTELVAFPLNFNARGPRVQFLTTYDKLNTRYNNKITVINKSFFCFFDRTSQHVDVDGFDES